MIKFKSILLENLSLKEIMDTKSNRKILAFIDKKKPDFKSKVRDYMSKSNLLQPFKKTKINQDITLFLKKYLESDQDEITILTFLYLLNYDVDNFLTDELNFGDNVYLTTIEHVGDITETTISPWVDCEYCDGMGEESDLCSFCGGTGEVEEDDGEDIHSEECIDCGGTGSVPYTCKYCGGDGGYYEETIISNQDFYIDSFLTNVDMTYESPSQLETGDFIDFVGLHSDDIICFYKSSVEVKSDDNETLDNINEILEVYSDKITFFDIKYTIY